MKTKIIGILTLLTAIFLPLNIVSQTIQPVNDEQKQRQIDAMENGSWNFAPGIFYWTWHKDYSGAKASVSIFPPDIKYKFSESRSNVKRCALPRTMSMANQKLVLDKTKAELDSITPLYTEEIARYAERIVDLSYPSFKGEFEKLQNSITGKLNMCLERSNGEMGKMVEAVLDENDLVCAQIQYIHKTGADYQIETTKRQIAYEEARQQMIEIDKASTKLLNYAIAHY